MESSWLQLPVDVLRFLTACRAFEQSKKNHWLAVWVQRLQPFGQSALSRVQLTAGRNGHNRHFDRPSLVSSVLRSVYEKNRAVRVVGRVFPWRTSLAPTDGSETRGFCMHGHDLASDRQGYFVKRPRKICVRSKSTPRQAGRLQRRGLLRTLNKQFWAC